MHEPSYRQAIRRAMALLSEQKGVWIFGVLSLLLGQIGWNNFVGGLIFFSETQPLSSYFFIMPMVGLWQGANFFWSLWLGIIMLAICIFAIVLAIISEGALLATAISWYKGEQRINLKKAWHRGAKHFWRLLFLHFIKRLLLVLSLIGLNLSIIYLQASGWPSSTFFVIAAVTVGLFFALAIATVGIFAAAYIIEEELPLFESISKGAALFFEHMLVSLEASLILLVIQMFVILLFMLSSTWFLLPFVAFTVIGGLAGAEILIAIGLLLSIALFFVVAALIGGLLNAFSVATWMYLFMKMHHEGIGSRIMRLLRLKRL